MEGVYLLRRKFNLWIFIGVGRLGRMGFGWEGLDIVGLEWVMKNIFGYWVVFFVFKVKMFEGIVRRVFMVFMKLKIIIFRNDICFRFRNSCGIILWVFM